MCLILAGWQVHPDYPLVVAANRDEFYARPTDAAAFWHDHPDVFGGRDRQAGGTWLAAHRDGRFAAVTNVREPGVPAGKLSRGKLTAGFLRQSLAPEDFAAGIACQDYSGFNLLLADMNTLLYLSNRHAAGEPDVRILPPGIYGMSNQRLDTPWPKLVQARAAFAAALASLPASEAFFALLADRQIAPDHELPDTGVPLEWERLLSTVFVTSSAYGTRASTLYLRNRAGAALLLEKSFAPGGEEIQLSQISTGV